MNSVFNKTKSKRNLGFMFLFVLLLCFTIISPVQAKKSSFKIQKGILLSYSGKSKTVTIPNTVTSIGAYAFSENKYIQTVVIPSSVKTINNYAFSKCPKLKKVTMKSGVTTIDTCAFSNCKSLSTITIPKTVKKIAYGAFENTAWLKKQKSNFVTVGNGVLIKYNGKSKSVTLPSSVKYIADGTFSKSKITKIKLTNNVKEIGESVFADCTKLTSVTLSNKLKKISLYAFTGCTNLKTISIPDSVKTIESNAFNQCKKLTTVNLSNTSKLTTVKREAFLDCNSLKTINLPNTVKTIEPSAFERCGLTTITIPSSITVLDEYIFRDCSNLQTVNLPNNLEAISTEVFRGCASLMDIKLPSTVHSIGFDAFAETGLFAKSQNFIIADDHVLLQYLGTDETVTIPDSITLIAENAFQGNQTMSQLILGKNTEYINTRAFFDCANLETVILNDSLKTIGSSAFMDCPSLKSITFPDSLTSIGNYAFFNCTALATFNFSNTPVKYGITPLSNTKWYDSYDSDFVVTKDGTLLGYKGSEKTITLPKTVKSLSQSAFEYTHFKNITIHGNIDKTPFSLFYYSDVENVIFEDGVTEIGSRCFEECYSLETIRIPDSVTKIANDIFTLEESSDTELTIICSKGSYAEQFAKKHKIKVQYE